MLAYFMTVGQQILAMALMVLVGYILCKRGILGERGLSELSQLLLKIVAPMIILQSFQKEFSKALFQEWLWMLALVLLSYFVQIMLATLFYRDHKKPRIAESRIAVAFPNNGFMAFPIMTALIGENGIFLGASNVIFLNILFWTYGATTLNPGTKMNFKKIISNPGLIALVAGLLLFISPWKLPAPVFQAVSSIGALNTPLAMIVLGGFLAQTNLKEVFKTPAMYKNSFIKLILNPCVMFAILYFLPIPDSVKLATAICAVTPAATAVSMLAEIYDRDFRYASGLVMISSILSGITMPIMLTLGKMVLGF